MASEPNEIALLRLASIVTSADDAIISKDVSGTIVSWNRAAERIFGYTESEAIGQSIRLIVPPERYHEEEAVLRRVRAGESVNHYETVYVRTDGQRIDVSLTISPIVTPAGQTIGTSTIARDITESRRFERDARHFAAFIESSDDAIISKDLNGTIVSWNPAAERLFGYTADEIIGQSVRVIIPPDRQSEEDHVYFRAAVFMPRATGRDRSDVSDRVTAAKRECCSGRETRASADVAGRTSHCRAAARRHSHSGGRRRPRCARPRP